MEYIWLVPVLIGIIGGIFFLLIFNLVLVFPGWLGMVTLPYFLPLLHTLLKHLLHKPFAFVVILFVFPIFAVFRGVPCITRVRSTFATSSLGVFPSILYVVIAILIIRIIYKFSVLIVLQLSCPLLFKALKVWVAELCPLCIIHVTHWSLESLFLCFLVNVRGHQLLVTLIALLRVCVCLFLCGLRLRSHLLFNIEETSVQSHFPQLNSHINNGCQVSLGGSVPWLEVQVGLILGREVASHKVLKQLEVPIIINSL